MRRERQKSRKIRTLKKLLTVGLYVLIPILIGAAIFGSMYYNDSILGKFGMKKEKPITKPVVSSNSILEIEKQLRDKGFQFDGVKKSTGSARLYTTLDNGTTVVFSDSQDISYQVSSLQLILPRLTIEQDKKIKLIDLRFNKPIVKF